MLLTAYLRCFSELNAKLVQMWLYYKVQYKRYLTQVLILQRKDLRLTLKKDQVHTQEFSHSA